MNKHLNSDVLSSKVYFYLFQEYEFDVRTLSKFQVSVVNSYIQRHSAIGVSNIAGKVMMYFNKFGY